MATLASSVKGTVMKTDAVLTMDEYLDQRCALPKLVSPPVRDARHVPVTAENDLDSGTDAHACRCDRWGHPCPGVSSPRCKPPLGSRDFASVNK